MIENLTHDEAIILGILGQFENPVLRTKIVKLVFLLDQSRHQATGRQATSYGYTWDHHGPNAKGNAVTYALEGLEQKNAVAMTKELTPYGNPAFRYEMTEHVDLKDLPLTPDDWVFIKSAFDRFGMMGREQIVATSKQTDAVRGANQYDDLCLTFSPTAQRLQREFSADAEFVQSTLAGASLSGAWISWEELKAEIEPSQQIAV